jgi:hypothetical protein
MEKIINHIENIYGFQLVPYIPKNQFQLFKRNFYIFILRNISERLFYFLRDKFSPIIFKDGRPDGEVWMKRKFETLYEVEIAPILNRNYFKVTLYYSCNFDGSTLKSFLIGSNKIIECIDSNFSSIPELRKILREHKLKEIFE